MPFLPVAKISDVEPGQVRVFQVDGKHLALANVGGAIFAIDDVCTHDGGPLGEGTLFNDLVECPRHGARFNVRTGRPVTLPAVIPVRTYEVQVEGDEIRVRIEGA